MQSHDPGSAIMISVTEARALIAQQVAASLEGGLGSEEIPLRTALRRVLAKPVCADRDDPAFDKSLMDGYAMQAIEQPGRIAVIGRVEAGQIDLPEVRAGQAVWINTGAPIPPGANAVAPVEWTKGDAVIVVDRAVKLGANILPRAHLVHEGDELISGRLTPERIAVCAAAGADPVQVACQPRVGVLSTGSELGQDPGPHGIRNSNGPLLAAMLADCSDVWNLGSVVDELAALRSKIEQSAPCEVIVTSGGVSMGDRDYVRPVLEELGFEILIHGVALQPGKPFLFARKGSRFAFGLPGNPASAAVCAELFLIPFCRALQGEPFASLPLEASGVLEAAIQSSPKRQRVFPCRLVDGRVHPLPWRSSADLYTLAHANAYVVIETGRDYAAGDSVRCLMPSR
jgi:molybdopterin molybdotransferase